MSIEPVFKLHSESIHTKSVLIRQGKNTGMVLDPAESVFYHPAMAGLLTTLRERAGLSQSRLAELVGTSQPQIQRLEQGTRGLTKKWAARIAQYVHTTPEELMFGEQAVPIVATLSTNGIGFFEGEGSVNLRLAHMPRGGTEDTVAVEVRGGGLGGAFEGWLIYHDKKRAAPTEEMLGEPCVVGLRSGQILVRTLMHGRVDRRYDLFPVIAGAGLPLTDQEVLWATRIIAIMPPRNAPIADEERRATKRKQPKKREIKKCGL